jgi:hypothetical protein
MDLPDYSFDLAVKLFGMHRKLAYSDLKEQNMIQMQDIQKWYYPEYFKFIFQFFTNCLRCKKLKSYSITKEQNKTIHNKENLKYFEKFSSHVEVIDYDGNLRTIYFPIDPCFHHLIQEYKTKLWKKFGHQVLSHIFSSAPR